MDGYDLNRAWRGAGALILLLLAAMAMAAGNAFASPHNVADPSASLSGGDILSITSPLKFSVDGRMKRNVQFWVDIYSKYDTHQGLIHDAKYIDHIYETLDFQKAGESREKVIRNAKKRWKDLLLSLHRKKNKPESWSEDEKSLAKLYEDVNEPNKFLNAAHRKRMRYQQGLRSSFMQGLHYSGRYLPIMEEIFRKEGLPIELTRLPFVESSFNLKARSKVGASGIWQFMRSTGRLFVKVNDAVDERNDPIRATEAAAKLLKLNFESLKNWPLAVTAYNHGRKGMERAVRKVGSEELEELVSDYRSRSFGFASSNFFTELLAAIEVEKNADKYFGKVERAKVLEGMEISIPDYVAMSELCQFLKLDLAALRELNPGLSEAVFAGNLMVPAGYVLRLPLDSTLSKDAQVRVFMAGYEQIPALYKLKAQKRYRKVAGQRKQREM